MVPLVRPVTVHPVAVVAEHLKFPVVDVTAYPVTAAPPSVVGGDQLNVAVPFPGIALTDAGAEGTVDGTTAALGVEGIP
jgi:hypothetical protein